MNSQPTTGHKVAAEVLGTFVLVFFGVGAAVMTGAFNEAAHPSHYVTTGLAFGLTVLVMASAVGRISGGHFNPAVTLGAAVAGRLSWSAVPLYWISQIVGGVLAGAALFFILGTSDNYDVDTMGMGANGFGDASAIGISLGGALVIEALLTAVFLWVILAVTDSRTEVSAVLAPAAIGMMLTLIHFASMSATGTSVNPARSFGPALFAGGDALSQVWVFFVAPLVGAAIAGVSYAFMFGKDPAFDENTPEEPFEDLDRSN
ncbi:MIP family channel protein [Nocardioides yefusunii]|uniref:MIP family channel protein n=1 Tax=Nocardioides yefusunii TaxID=2500546 RepID=A0ABW1QXU0_9ACTN|nr:MIP family channel protein [Nocardioides yefusunii]